MEIRYKLLFILLIISGIESGKIATFSSENIDTNQIKYNNSIKYSNAKKYNHINENSLYSDIINHAKKPVLSYDRTVNAHETTHMIHGEYSNIDKMDGFYIPNHGITYLNAVKFPKSNIINFIPTSLRGSRYNLYIVGQNDWKDYPYYILNEWSAYINDAEVGIDDFQNNRSDLENKTDLIMGPLEFSIYSCALGMIIKEKYPENWPEYKVFLNYQLNRSFDLYQKGLLIDKFKWQNSVDYLNNLKNNSDSSNLRKFLIEECNSVWLR